MDHFWGATDGRLIELEFIIFLIELFLISLSNRILSIVGVSRYRHPAFSDV